MKVYNNKSRMSTRKSIIMADKIPDPPEFAVFCRFYKSPRTVRVPRSRSREDLMDHEDYVNGIVDDTPKICSKSYGKRIDTTYIFD